MHERRRPRGDQSSRIPLLLFTFGGVKRKARRYARRFSVGCLTSVTAGFALVKGLFWEDFFQFFPIFPLRCKLSGCTRLHK